MDAIKKTVDPETGKETWFMSRSQAINYYHLHNQGQYTTFLVRKRTEPDHIEHINGRSAVKKFLKGGKLKYDPAMKGLIPLYRQGQNLRNELGQYISEHDPSSKQHYAMIAIEGIVEIRMKNLNIKVMGE